MNASNNISADMFGKVAVLMGGTSAEREISLNSGHAVLAALQGRGVDAHAVDVGADIIPVLEQGKFDRAFVMLHGRGGEDGVIQGALEVMGIPYTGSGVLASALCMDKLRSKQIWQASGVPTPGFVMLNEATDLETVIAQLGLPLIVKPSQEGSSIGMTRVTEASQLQGAWDTAAQYDTDVMAEQWISGSEYTAAILGHEVLPLIRIETGREFYDFDAKYVDDTTRFICPCGLDEASEKEMQALALRAFDLLGAEAWGRIDFMCDADGQPWFIEANTLPGMTDHSLVPMAAHAAGIEFDELVVRILVSSLSSASVGAAAVNGRKTAHAV